MDQTEHRIVLVTGPSGAGRSTAIHALEDMGYEVIDNLPLSLVPRLMDGPPLDRPVALGLDVRNRDFAASAIIELIDRLTRDPRVTVEVLYLDCAASELVRRYSQTRRRHPMALSDTPEDGIAREVDLLAPIRVRADHLIDTTEMSPHDLKADLGRWFGADAGPRLTVSLQSFSYKRGLPRGLDMVFDCRFLSNPHWLPALRDLDGRDAPVAEHVKADPRFPAFFEKLADMVQFLLPAQLEEGKAHLSIGFGCTGGQHRSVMMVETLAYRLAETGWPVSKRHRELERRAVAHPPTQTG
ncbi:MAG: RNase adapter RapZ [Paracoccaceae bacterium]|nr:MAG: RNase adapter RapZ [Paracoccaceae bacterium]